MVKSGLMAIRGSMGFVALIAGSIVCRADALDSSLVGAWAISGPDCARVFQRRGGALAFRQPVDEFAQATIIGPQQIVLSSSTCRVQSVSHPNGAITVNADCNDSVSSTAKTMQIKVKSAGEIIFNSTGDPAFDATLIKCRFDPGAPSRD
jgi:hypothetical protein